MRASGSKVMRMAGIVAVGTVSGLLAAPALGVEVFTSGGLTFVGVRDAGNRGATLAEAPLWPTWAPALGAVDHDFGIMRTNVTNAEWIEFVRAYGPYYAGEPDDWDLTGRWINYTGMVGGVPQYQVQTGAASYSAEMTWRVAARFANWLHNDRVNQPWAFENGAYDTSTFGEVVVGGVTMLTDQRTHHPDARFWIPTVDEYTKAAHWDPNKFGPGQGGYWLMPDGGDERLVAGPPGVGEAAGDSVPPAAGIAVGSYPDTQSPWGMWDVSSTYDQFTEGWVHPTSGIQRLGAGSSAGESGYWVQDRLDTFSGFFVRQGAFRIATVTPSPSVCAVLGAHVILSHMRRRT